MRQPRRYDMKLAQDEVDLIEDFRRLEGEDQRWISSFLSRWSTSQIEHGAPRFARAWLEARSWLPNQQTERYAYVPQTPEARLTAKALDRTPFGARAVAMEVTLTAAAKEGVRANVAAAAKERSAGAGLIRLVPEPTRAG